MGNSESPIQFVFWRGPVPASTEFIGAGALKEDLGLRWVGMLSPVYPHSPPPGTACLPHQSALDQKSLICCLFSSSTGGMSDNLLDFSHIG